MKRENGRGGDRVSSQIYEEVVRYLKRSPTKEAKYQANFKAAVTVIVSMSVIY